jgi:transglutaminase-like putative cysteine protease
MMSKLVRAGKKRVEIRQTAVELTQGFRQKDWMREISALFDFVQNRIRYVRDIRGVETLHTPEKVLENEQGDCDDKSILLASLLEAIGHPTRFVAVGFSPGQFSHVFVETKVHNRWLSLETTEPVAMGWKPNGIKAAMIVHN